MNAKKFYFMILFTQILALGFTKGLLAKTSKLALKNGDVIAIQGNNKESFCYVNENSQLICNQKRKITEKSLFKVKIINQEESIIALSVGPDFTNYCQYDDSSKKVLCDYEEEQPGSWEWFQWVSINQGDSIENQFALKAGTTGYKSFCGQNNGKVTCDRNYQEDHGTTFQYYILQKEKNNHHNFLNLAKNLKNKDEDFQSKQLEPNMYLSQGPSENNDQTLENKNFQEIEDLTTEPSDFKEINDSSSSYTMDTPDDLPPVPSSKIEKDNFYGDSVSKAIIKTLESTEKKSKKENPIRSNCTAKNWKKFKPNLSGCDLQFVNFSDQDLKGWDFTYTKLNFTQFKEADLAGVKFDNAQLNNTNFAGADLRGAHFRGSKIISVQFKKADMRYVKFEETSIEASDFEGARLSDSYFILTTLKNNKFNHAEMKYVQMICSTEKKTFDQKNYPNTFLGVDFEKSNLEHCDLSGTNLSKINFYKANLAYINLTGANLIKANFEKANLSHSIFTDADLTKANLEKTIIFHTNFTRSNLTKAFIKTHHILKSNFKKANLKETVIRDTNFINCDFSNQNLNIVKFRGHVGFFASTLINVKLQKQNLTKISLLGSDITESKLKSFAITFANESKKHKAKMCVSYNAQKNKVRRSHIKCTLNLKPGQHASITDIPGDATYIHTSIYGDKNQTIEGSRTWRAINEDKKCIAKGILFEQAASCE